MSKEKSKRLAQGVEYYPESNTLLLIRCPKCGRENWAPQVASGTCAWCGYDGHELLKEQDNGERRNDSKANCGD